MELIDLLRVLRRWLWLIIAVVVVTQLALWLGMRSTEPVYAATVKLQISIPQREDVAAYDQSRSINARDEITAAINNFIELLQSSEAKRKAVSQLGLVGKDASYTVSAIRTTDTDFIKVTVEARTPNLAAEIANTHVAMAIAYYGELRAQSTKAEKELFAEQLRLAEEGYRAAEKALADFRTQNGIYSLDSQLVTQQRLLEQLQSERDQRALEQAITVITVTDSAIPATSPLVIDPVKEVDNLIAQRLKELDHFTSLIPQYHILTQNLDQALTVYQHLLDKYSEAVLRVTAVQSANFIQVIKPAVVPTESVSSWPRLAVLALAGSLGLAVVLAFLLQYITGFKTASVAVPVNDQKIPPPSHAGRKFWERPAKIFRRNEPSPSFEHASPVSYSIPAAEQETNALENGQAAAVSVAVPLHDQETPSFEHASLISSTGPAAEQEPNAMQELDPTFHDMSVTGPANDQKESSFEQASPVSNPIIAVEQEPIAMQDEADATFKAASVTVPVSDQKTSSRRKQSGRKHRSTTAERKPIAAQSQHGSKITK